MGYYDTLPPALSPEETRQAARDGNINKIIEGNVRLVLSVAHRYQGACFDDLVQEGTLGLIEAAKRYDPERGQFSTYAIPWIEKYILQSLQSESPLRVTDYGSRQGRRIKEETERLQQELRRDPTIDELAEATGYTRKAIKRSQIVTVQIDDAEELAEYNSTDDIHDKIMGEDIYNHLYLLTEKEREVIYHRFGFTSDVLTQQETANKMGYSREWIKKLESSAIKKLQEAMT